MERLPAGWTSVDDPDGDGHTADADADEADADGGGGAADSSAGRPAAVGAPHRPTVLVVGGLAGIVVAAALVILASGAPRPTVTIGDGSAPGPTAVDAGRTAETARGTRLAASGAASVAGGDVVIDVEGAVARPGVYHVPAGSRLADALRAAGGFSAAVDVPAVERDLNLASTVADGAKVRVPALGQATVSAPAGTITPAPASGSTAAAGALIDLNHASPEQLDTLPGVGPATAAKIVAARAERPFGTVDELGERGVVGPSTLAKLRDLVTVGP